MTRLSVGYVSPLPPVRSGVADYAAELLPELERLAEVTEVRAYAPEKADRAVAGGHDVLLFQIGNDPLHAPSVEALASPERRTPAVVVLHDFVLHHLFAAAYLDRGREDAYARELERAHGERGRALGEKALAGLRFPVWDLAPWTFPMSAGLIRDAQALIVHSRLVRGAVLRERPLSHVVEIPHHVVPAPRTPRDEARQALGLPLDRAVAVSLGVVTPAKRIDVVLRALAALPPSERPFLFVGGAVGLDDPLRDLVASLELAGDVAFGGYLSDEDFWRAASAADFAINLRHPTMGETSGAVCRLAGFGLPFVVSDTGWFRELPDALAFKAPVGAREIEALAGAFSRLGIPEERRRRSGAARAWGEERSPAKTARRYSRVLQDVVDGRAPSLALRGLLATELHALGVAGSGRLGAVSRAPDARLLVEVGQACEPLLPRERVSGA